MGRLQQHHEKIKSDVLALLDKRTPEKIITESDRDPTLLYLSDKALNNELINLKFLLEKEFEDPDKDVKRYGFNKIVNLLNPGEPVGTYFWHIEKKWKLISTPDKVLARLDEELAVWANSYRLHSFKELDESKEASEAYVTEQKKLIEGKIKEAEDKCAWLKEHFDELETVKICAKKRSYVYGTVHFKINGKPVKRHLSYKLPNVLYYEKPHYRSNNTIDQFLEKAENAFGDVYFIR